MATPQPTSKKMKKHQRCELENSSLGTYGAQLEKNDDDSSLELKLLEETQHLQNIFPEEIWMLVINQLNDSHEDYADMQKLCNTSPYFRKLLLPQRVVFLFPKVLPAILPELLKNEEEESVENQTSDSEAEEGYIDMDKIDDKIIASDKREMGITMNLRSVCAMWSEAVHFYVKEFSTVVHEYDFMYFKMIDCFKTTDLYVSKFLRHFESSHPSNSKRSPFVQRSVKIYYLHDGLVPLLLFTNRMTILLEKYGHHIWQHLFHCDLSEFPYSRLRDWLQLMCNLKDLRVENDPSTFSISVDKITQFETELRGNPFPPLHKLKTLDTSMLSPPVSLEIIRQSPNLSSLKIKPIREEQYLASYNFFSFSLRKLESVKVYFCTEKDVVKISQSENASSWPLKSLELLEWDKEDFISWTTIFQVIQDKWGATLETLCLDLPVTNCKNNCEMLSILQDSHTFRLNLPKVRTLKLKFNNPTHLDFLLPMKESLETLRIEIPCQIPNAKSFWKQSVILEATIIPVVEFIGYENNMLKSNIWTLFPCLKELSLVNGNYYTWCTRPKGVVVVAAWYVPNENTLY